MDASTHKRYLDYRERHAYFGRSTPLLAMDDFARLDAEHRALHDRGESRDDEEEARWNELSHVLLRD